AWADKVIAHAKLAPHLERVQCQLQERARRHRRDRYGPMARRYHPPVRWFGRLNVLLELLRCFRRTRCGENAVLWWLRAYGRRRYPQACLQRLQDPAQAGRGTDTTRF